jgi:hypothetical protein
MLKKTISYTDYDGNERTEDFYFNLSKAEITMMEMSFDGGMTKMLDKIVAAKEGKRIMEVFKDLILRSYGEKSPDGRRFIKNNELREAFEQTVPYSMLFVELCTDAKAAAVFVEGIVPSIPNK